MLVENRQFEPTPPLLITQLEFRRNFWLQKNKDAGLSYGVVCMILCLAVLVQCRLVTDGQMDRQTDRHTTMTAYTALA